MKKILYISVNSKEEAESASKTVARKLINEVLNQCRYRVPKTHNHSDGSNKSDNECLCKDELHNYIDVESHKDDIKKACCEEKQKPIEEKIVGETKYNVDIHENDKNKYQFTDVNNMAKNALEKHGENTQDIPEQENINNPEKPNEQKINYEDSKKDHKNTDTQNDKQDEKSLKPKAEELDKQKECCDEKQKQHNDEKSYNKEYHNEKEKCYSEKIMDFIHDKLNDNSQVQEWKDCNEFVVEEIDLYKDYIPLLRHEYYECRNTVVEGPGPCYEKLTNQQKKDVDRIKELAKQFKEADIYVIAAPMWSLLFPAPLKQYIDCIMLNGVTAEINKHECKGLLDDKERKMIFVQSVGGELPILIKSKLDHSGAYLKDIAKFLKISKFEELLVDGTGYTESAKEDAIYEAEKDIAHIVKMLIK